MTIDAFDTPETRRPARRRSISMLRAPGGAQDTQQAKVHATPTPGAPAGADTRPTKGDPTPSQRASGGTKHASRQTGIDTQRTGAAGAQPTDRQDTVDNHELGAVGSRYRLGPSGKRGLLFDPALAFAAKVLDDIEAVRKAQNSRLKILTRKVPDEDGVMRGFGLDENHPDVAALAESVTLLKVAEDAAVKTLERMVRHHPLGKWQKSTKGIGAKQLGRLLGAIGDPYVRAERAQTDGTVIPAQPRTLGSLYRYSGNDVLPAADQVIADTHTHGVGGGAKDGGDPGQAVADTQLTRAGVAPRHRTNQKSAWKPDARMWANRIADRCVQQTLGETRDGTCVRDESGWLKHCDGCACSPYRLIYDDGRRKYLNAIHTSPCPRCGPSGKPAPTGSPLSDKHKEARATRLAAKRMLKDLWREAKRLHEQADSP